MANIKSAIKRAKVSQKANVRNRAAMSALRTALKKFFAAAETGDKESTAALYTKTVSLVDKACAKGIIHKNAANRKKSQIDAHMAKAQ